MAVSDKWLLCAELPPEARLGRLCLVEAQQAVQESWAHLDPCVTHGCFPQRGQLQGKDQRAIWAEVCEILPRMPWELMRFKYNTLTSWTCVFLCSCLPPDNFPVVVKLQKETPGTKVVFWFRILVQVNGSKSILVHTGCNSLNISNSLLMSCTHAQTKAVDQPGGDLRPRGPTPAAPRDHFLCQLNLMGR